MEALTAGITPPVGSETMPVAVACSTWPNRTGGKATIVRRQTQRQGFEWAMKTSKSPRISVLAYRPPSSVHPSAAVGGFFFILFIPIHSERFW
jgi:hypothetical protein